MVVPPNTGGTVNTRTDPSGTQSAKNPAPSRASGSPRPEKPDPLAPPSHVGVKVDRDPLAKGSVRPNPSGDLDE